MMDDEDQMTLVVIAVNNAQLQRAPGHQIHFGHPVLKPGTELCAKVLPLPKALTMAMDKANHDWGALLIELRDGLWEMSAKGEA